MTPSPSADVLSRLDALLAQDRLAAKTRRAAERLRDRLNSPVRLALLGPPGGGKTALANVISGAALIPPGRDLPSLQVSYAEQPGLTAVLGDRSRREFRSLDFDAALGLSPAFLEIQAPEPRLKAFSLLQLVTDGSAAELRAAAAWAARRSDMAVWVSQSMDAAQLEIWRGVPAALKDHGFLALTATNAGAGTAARQLAGNDFRRICPVDAGAALAALNLAGTEAARAGTGCKSLIRALTDHAESGRQADVDGAAMFLQRYAPADAPIRTGSEATAEAVAPAAVDAPTSAETAETASAPLDLGDLNALSLESAFAEFATGADESDAGQAAVTLIRDRAQALMDRLDTAEDVPADQVLECCVETVQSLEEITPEDPRLQDTLMQATDYLVLLQLEQNDQAAVEAVVALLQVKREYELALAA